VNEGHADASPAEMQHAASLMRRGLPWHAFGGLLHALAGGDIDGIDVQFRAL
jgi:hypothetical protein